MNDGMVRTVSKHQIGPEQVCRASSFLWSLSARRKMRDHLLSQPDQR